MIRVCYHSSMPPELPSQIERPTQFWLDQEAILIERAKRLARDERLGAFLHDAALATTRRAVDASH
ncbi:hypothetical protein A3E39_02695 [Candidatus Uhrbacteria bacterium RIFCSPHIGHO2_12_FULL_60_25]|uniref:Uncharacterized protein n=1 Tax=Candidatus Uhrbacteria bacterium RIFCSPHIGHO2_12_FULL_60_25 TaxID=1802399 RepID=A0A1F7UJD0_9BACT|nr:MAG: hypothetical protein A3E39_02695 [Candidatus Uhrbacteria bacterium RIFCSPHIGHO2_12_FULL_60_25]